MVEQDDTAPKEDAASVEDEHSMHDHTHHKM